MIKEDIYLSSWHFQTSFIIILPTSSFSIYIHSLLMQLRTWCTILGLSGLLHSKK